MKPHHLAISCTGLGLLLGFVLAILIRTPCPDLSVQAPSQAIIEREAVRDSIAERRAIRRHILDSIAANPINREINIRIARSLGRTAQLDTLLADPR